MNSLYETTLVYLFRDDEVLLMLRDRKKNDINEGKWIAPGGKLEEGETASECAVREVLEETGYLCNNIKYAGKVFFSNDVYSDEIMYIYKCSSFEKKGEPVSDEGMLKWIKKDSVMELNMWEGDRLFTPYILSGRDFFDMKLVYSGDILKQAYDGGRLIYERQQA